MTKKSFITTKIISQINLKVINNYITTTYIHIKYLLDLRLCLLFLLIYIIKAVRLIQYIIDIIDKNQ